MSWYVRNVREMKWWDRGPRGFVTEFVDADPQVGVNLFVLAPGQPMAMYHWEADQEGFLLLSGEALLIVDDEERPLRQWDYFHCPPNVSHTIVGWLR
jgi:quercetin dioxygenase-like cupin family protein